MLQKTTPGKVEHVFFVSLRSIYDDIHSLQMPVLHRSPLPIFMAISYFFYIKRISYFFLGVFTRFCREMTQNNTKMTKNMN